MRSSAVRASRYPLDAHHAASELRKSVGMSREGGGATLEMEGVGEDTLEVCGSGVMLRVPGWSQRMRERTRHVAVLAMAMATSHSDALSCTFVKPVRDDTHLRIGDSHGRRERGGGGEESESERRMRCGSWKSRGRAASYTPESRYDEYRAALELVSEYLKCCRVGVLYSSENGVEKLYDC